MDSRAEEVELLKEVATLRDTFKDAISSTVPPHLQPARFQSDLSEWAGHLSDLLAIKNPLIEGLQLPSTLQPLADLQDRLPPSVQEAIKKGAEGMMVDWQMVKEQLQLDQLTERLRTVDADVEVRKFNR